MDPSESAWGLQGKEAKEEEESLLGQIVHIEIPEADPEGKPKTKPDKKNWGKHKFPGRPPQLVLPQFCVVTVTAWKGGGAQHDEIPGLLSGQVRTALGLYHSVW